MMIKKLRCYFLIVAGFALLPAMSGCDTDAGYDASPQTKTKTVSVISDQPISDFQKELLDLSFDTASSIAVNPHRKDRSSAQEKVVITCLKLDQTKRAMEYIKQIDNWRRGLCYAHVAFYCAQNGYELKQVHKILDLADMIAKMDHGQKWRNDRIRTRIAQTYTLLGQTDKASAFQKDQVDSEIGKVTQIQTALADEDSFDQQVQALDNLVALQGFETTINALHGYAELFNRFYENPQRRDLAEEKIKSSWEKLPVGIRVEILLNLGGFSMDHSDPNKALQLAGDVQNFLNTCQWSLEERIPVTAQLIELRFRAGEKEKARADADEALSLYEAQSGRIIDIYRAETLCPLAQAYQTMGDTERAIWVYQKVVEEGVVNPNPRPRAQDLSATCCSMAMYAVEPNEALWNRMKQISKELTAP